MSFIVVTNPAGDKHVQSVVAETFWLRHNGKNHPSFHVKVNHFETEEEAIKYANTKAPEVTAVPKGGGMSEDEMEAEIQKRVEAALRKKSAQAKVSDKKG